MNIVMTCDRCDEEGYIDTRYDMDINPYDITESGEVKLRLVEHEMFVDSSYGRCANGHRDPAAFIVGAIQDYLEGWDTWLSQEEYRSKAN